MRILISSLILIFTCGILLAATDDDIFDEDLLSPEEVKAAEAAKPPVLKVDAKPLAATLEMGKSVAFEITVINEGGQKLEYEIDAPVWMSASKQMGSLGFEQKDTITLTVDTSENKDIDIKELKGTLRITAEGVKGAPVALPINISIRQKPKPKPITKPKPKPKQKAVSKFKQKGIQLGLVMLTPDFDKPAQGGPLIKFNYSLPVKSNKNLLLELSYGHIFPRNLGDFESEAHVVAADFIWQLNPKYYLGFGGGYMLEAATENSTGTTYNNHAGLANLSCGMLFSGGKFDIRMAIQFFIGTDNAAGQSTLGVGYRF